MIGQDKLNIDLFCKFVSSVLWESNQNNSDDVPVMPHIMLRHASDDAPDDDPDDAPDDDPDDIPKWSSSKHHSAVLTIWILLFSFFCENNQDNSIWTGSCLAPDSSDIVLHCDILLLSYRYHYDGDYDSW